MEIPKMVRNSTSTRKEEVLDCEKLTWSADQRLYQNPPNIFLDDAFESLEISQELLVSTPLENANNLLPKKDATKETAKKRNKSKRPRVYQMFADKYERSNIVLGRGARSLVETVIEKTTKKEFAVKIIKKDIGYDRSGVLREIDLLHITKNHPNILALIESFEEDECFYLVFEKMQGGPLLNHIYKKMSFTEREASWVIKDVASALKFLHEKGVAHRDLKPENILCRYEDRIVPVKICDFNLASGLDSINCPTPELYTPVGSAEFMAPEVIEAFQGDAPAYDKRCDLWSLGVILYIMLCGKPPFVGNCGEDCEWEKGGSCYECQRTLWNSIKKGEFQFHDKEWEYISDEAKDLVSKLLVKNASKRLTADQVVRHPWVAEGAKDVILKTPTVLGVPNKDNQLDPFSLMSTEVLAYSRIQSQQKKAELKDSFTDIINETSWPKAGFGLSPPGKSSLARRRAEHLKRKEEKLREVRCAENPIEDPALTKQNFEKLSLASYKKPEETVRTP